MADKRRLVALGVPTQQAEELARQIDEGGGAGQALTVAERAEGKADTALIEAGEAQEDAAVARAGADAARAAPYVPFPDRAAAEAATVPPALDFINEAGLLRRRSPFGDLMTANGGLFAPLAGALGYNYTVRVPSQFPTIQSALGGTYGLRMSTNRTVTIMIESGHQLTHGWTIRGGDWSHYRIAAEDGFAETVETGFQWVSSNPIPGSSRAIMFYRDCTAPVLSCIIRGRQFARGSHLDYDGLMCFGNARVSVDAGCGVQRCRINCEIRQASTIDANSTDWSDAMLEGMRITGAGYGSISSSRFDNCQKGWSAELGDSNLSASLHISRASFPQAQDLIFNNSGCIHVNVRRSKASLIGCQFGTKDTVTGITRTRIAGILEGGEAVLNASSLYLGNPLTPLNWGVERFNVQYGDGTVVMKGADDVLTQAVAASVAASFNTILPTNLNTYTVKGRRATPDGVLEMWGAVEVPVHSMVTADGALFRSDTAISLTFPTTPVPFVSAPDVFVQARNPSARVWPADVIPSTTGFTALFLTTASNASVSVRFMWHAVGRWIAP